MRPQPRVRVHDRLLVVLTICIVVHIFIFSLIPSIYREWHTGNCKRERVVEAFAACHGRAVRGA